MAESKVCTIEPRVMVVTKVFMLQKILILRTLKFVPKSVLVAFQQHIFTDYKSIKACLTNIRQFSLHLIENVSLL